MPIRGGQVSLYGDQLPIIGWSGANQTIQHTQRNPYRVSRSSRNVGACEPLLTTMDALGDFQNHAYTKYDKVRQTT